MIRTIHFFGFLLFFGTSWSQPKYQNPDIPLLDQMLSLDFTHIVANFDSDTASFEIGEIMGKIEPLPKSFSKKFNDEINHSVNYYNKKEYQKAMTILESLLIHDSSNNWILYHYARACYQIDKVKSLNAYKKLVFRLDSIYKNTLSSTVIDLWYREAYWKLGTLYMDNKEWESAYYEISRFMLSAQDQKGNQIYTQGLEYLTECAYMLYDDKLAEYLAHRTLSYDPKNDYVKSILKKITKN